MKEGSTKNILQDIDCVIEPGARLAIPDATFDFVLLLDVLEHVRDPAFVHIKDWRLLKKNGRLVVSSPFLYQEHEAPHGFSRLTALGVYDLLARHDARILNMRKVGNSCYTLYILFLERGFVNGERSELGLFERVVNKCAVALLPILGPMFSQPPSDQAGVCHHLLVDVVFS